MALYQKTETGLEVLYPETLAAKVKMADNSTAEAAIAARVKTSDIVDALTSLLTNVPLSAKQGRVLKELIDNLTLADIGTGTEGVNAQAALDAKVQYDLLWENASPTSSFAAQTIALDLSGYSAIKIAYTPSATSAHSGIWVTELLIGDDTLVNGCYYWLVERLVEVTETGVIFGAGGRYEGAYGSSTLTTYSTGCVPLRIWGVR